jgi:hypothetical protein
MKRRIPNQDFAMFAEEEDQWADHYEDDRGLQQNTGTDTRMTGDDYCHTFH